MNTRSIELPTSLKGISLSNIFYSREKSPVLAKRVSELWFTFSSFMPKFLFQISNLVETAEIKNRLLEIMHEELGNDVGGKPHFDLYRDSLQEIGLTTKKCDSPSINKLSSIVNSYKNDSNSSEAFAAGLSFGLEIIAEENIRHLMKYSSFNQATEEVLKETTFFRIHLMNEIEHIRKCLLNFESVSKDNSKKEAFIYGMEVGLNFWRQFWKESLNEEAFSS